MTAAMRLKLNRRGGLGFGVSSLTFLILEIDELLSVPAEITTVPLSASKLRAIRYCPENSNILKRGIETTFLRSLFDQSKTVSWP